MGADVAGAADYEYGSALIDGDGGEGFVPAMGQVEQQTGQGQRRVGDEAPQGDRRRFTEKHILDGAGAEDGGEQYRGFEAAGSGLEAGVDAEDPVESQ